VIVAESIEGLKLLDAQNTTTQISTTSWYSP